MPFWILEAISQSINDSFVSALKNNKKNHLQIETLQYHCFHSMASDPIFINNLRDEKESFDQAELMELKVIIEGFKMEEVELNRQIRDIKDKLGGLELENEELRGFLDSGVHDSTDDEVNEKESRREEIDQLLEVMLARCTIGLLDLQMMSEEIGALKQYEAAVGTEMEVKMGELQDGLWELKTMIVELKGEKSKELYLMGYGREERKLGKGGGNWGLKLSWNAIVVCFGTVAAALTALLFLGKVKAKGKAQSES